MKRTLLLLLVLVLFSSAAVAGDVTLFAGLQHPAKITLLSVSQSTIRLLADPKDFAVIGARVSHGRGLIGFEHTLAFAPNFLESTNRAAIYNSNLIVQAPVASVRPYGTAGAGLVRSTGQGVSAFGNKLAYNYGGGVKFSVLPAIGARIDVRGYSIPKVQSKTLNVLEVSVGAFFSF